MGPRQAGRESAGPRAKLRQRRAALPPPGISQQLCLFVKRQPKRLDRLHRLQDAFRRLAIAQLVSLAFSLYSRPTPWVREIEWLFRTMHRRQYYTINPYYEPNAEPSIKSEPPAAQDSIDDSKPILVFCHAATSSSHSFLYQVRTCECQVRALTEC